MISFLVKKHLVRGGEMVEVWRDGIFVAAIYGHGNGLRIVSKYLGDVDREDGSVAVQFKGGHPQS